jgi:hypothetical protein
MNGVEDPDDEPAPRKPRGGPHTTARCVRECLGAAPSSHPPGVNRPPRRRPVAVSTRNVAPKRTVWFWRARCIGQGDDGRLIAIDP